MARIPAIFWLLARRGGYRRSYRRPRPIANHRLDGPAFDATCADLLREAGWQVREIGGPGDQGADLLATRRGTTVAIQCKNQTFPASNKAVQEVHAALAHHGAKRGIVICPAGYTQSAVALGRSTRVLLIDAEELPRLHVTLGLADPPPARPQPVLTRYEFRPQPAPVMPLPRQPDLIERLFGFGDQVDSNQRSRPIRRRMKQIQHEEQRLSRDKLDIANMFRKT